MPEEFFIALAAIGQAVEESWIFVFWGTLLLLAGVERFSPAFPHLPKRRERWPTNIGLGIVILLLATLSPVTSVLSANWASEQGIGLLNWIALPGWLSFAVTILLRSLFSYGFHVAGHKLPLLWRLHRVHHADTHLDVTTGLRSHPGEFLLILPILAIVTAAGGFSPIALIVYELAEALNSLLSHANIRLPSPMDRVLRLVFVTPNMHSAHHSSRQPETDSNYGSLFSFWDRVFGTYTQEPLGGYQAMKIGLDEINQKQAASFWWQVISPVLRLNKPDKAAAEERSSAR